MTVGTAFPLGDKIFNTSLKRELLSNFIGEEKILTFYHSSIIDQGYSFGIKENWEDSKKPENGQRKKDGNSFVHDIFVIAFDVR
jgi:hypothetical protein